MDDFWRMCLSHLENIVPNEQYKTWILPLNVKQEGQKLLVNAPNRFVLDLVRDKYVDEIHKLGKQFLNIDLEIVTGVRKDPAKTQHSSSISEENFVVKKPSQSPSVQQIKSTNRLNTTFTFDSFVTGKANQLARAAGLQVGDNPGGAYNPLFIYGGVGLGKTHLLHAIGNMVRSEFPKAKVRYTHAEQYVSDVVRAYQHKAFDGFKKFYHSLDLLLIDDVQFFGNKTRTQEEFFYAYNALLEDNKQVVITCDSYPKEISGIEDRLISRFGWGLTVAIEPPELEMRVAILLKKASSERISLGEDVAFFVANLIQSNVRELEGALKRIVAYSKFSKQPLSVQIAREALKDLLAVHTRQTSVENIQKLVADYFKIKVSDMFSKKRSRAVARPRQLAMALAKELTTKSLPDIGEAFGGRDHTTVLHACRKITSLRSQDLEIARAYDELLLSLRS
ncbi:MAG: chromosomal replication initiator protein DnaA [Proteobacteria bacterium]|nr:chromosomal replication initiator protein DnaA [Pseudomonadota bacterium]